MYNDTDDPGSILNSMSIEVDRRMQNWIIEALRTYNQTPPVSRKRLHEQIDIYFQQIINERDKVPNTTQPQPVTGPREPVLPQEIIPSQTISHEPYAPKDDDTEEHMEERRKKETYSTIQPITTCTAQCTQGTTN